MPEVGLSSYQRLCEVADALAESVDNFLIYGECCGGITPEFNLAMESALEAYQVQREQLR